MALLLILITFNFGVNPKKINEGEPLLFAHRGLANYFTENSTRSFEACKDIGLKAIEADVRQTKDGRLIIFHDNNCKRLLGNDANVDEVELSFFKDKYLISKDASDSLSVMTLDDFLQRYKDDFYIYLDMKHTSFEIADSLIQKFESYNVYQNCMVADADIAFLFYLKLKNERIITALEGFGAGKEFYHFIIPNRLMPDYFSSFLRDIDVDFVNFLERKQLVDRYIAYGVNRNNIVRADTMGIRNVVMDYDSFLGVDHSISDYARTVKNAMK